MPHLSIEKIDYELILSILSQEVRHINKYTHYDIHF